MKKWEYKVLTNPSLLEDAGRIGWELVSVVYLPVIGQTNFYLKREIIE